MLCATSASGSSPVSRRILGLEIAEPTGHEARDAEWDIRQPPNPGKGRTAFQYLARI